MSEPVRVESGPGSGVAEVARRIAERLGVAITFADSPDGHTRVGEVRLSTDPPLWAIEAAILRALRPEHILFLCVANSARSQIAEGLARRLVPPGTRVSSAGSSPSSVRPEAVQVLREIGIDISDHRSTGIDEVDGSVDAVITLCAEEVCPVWLEDASRLHWGLPDPAASGGSEEDRLDAFRFVRDELSERFSLLFG